MTEQEPTPTPAVQTIRVAQAPTNGLAVAAMVLGIVTIVIGIVPLIGLFISFIPTVLAIVFGILGMVRATKVQVGFGAALTGLILGGVTFLLYFTGYGLIW